MSRTSQVFRGRNSTIHRRRTSLLHDDHALYPILDSREIILVLQACDFDVVEEQVQKPNSQFMQKLTERLLETFTSTSVDTLVDQSQKVGQKDVPVSQQDSDSQSPPPESLSDTVPSLIKIVLARKAAEFFHMCGISDFSLVDLIRPEAYRTRQILSAVVNFIRFREDRAVEIEELATSAYDQIEQLRESEAKNIEVSNRISDLLLRLETSQESDGKTKPSLKEINVYNSKLENELRKLKKIQESLTQEHAQYKNEKARLIQNLEDINYVMLNQSKQIERLKDYDQIDVDLLHGVIDQLKASLAELSEKLGSLELQNRNVSITIDSFHVVGNELRNLFRILEEVLNDVDKEELVVDTLTRIQETLDQQTFESNDLARQILQIKRQLKSLEDKTEKLKVQSEEKSKKSQETIDQLKVDYDNALIERNHKDQELEKLREQISSIQNEMKARKLELEQEINNSEMAVSRLNSHLRVYLTEMNKKL